VKRALINTQDILKASKMNSFFGETTARILMNLLQLDRLTRIYSEIDHLEGMDFLDALLDRFEICYDVSEEELRRIPMSGPFITVSNHPFGGIDGLILLKLIAKLRPDYKIMGNFLLQRIELIRLKLNEIIAFKSISIDISIK